VLGGRWLPLKWGLFVAGAVLGLQALGAFERIEPLFTDLHFALRGELAPSGEVVVVGVSPKCTGSRELGPWPWPRAKHAELIRWLAEAGARVICYDMHFATPSRVSQNDDAEMAEAARGAGNVLLAVYHRESLDKAHEREGPLLRVHDVAQNLPLLSQATEQGHINVRHDVDGVIRRVPAGLAAKSGRYYQLGLLAAARYLGVGPEGIRSEPGGLRIGDRLVPVSASGNILVNYYHLPEQGATYFVSDILGEHKLGGVPPSAFRGKIVFIGQTDHGLQNADLVVTPEGDRFGVYVQAAIADNIVSGRMLHRAPPLALALVVLALSIGCASRLFARRVLGKVAWSLAFALAAVLLSQWLFERLHMVLDLTPCLAAVVVGNLYGALVFGIVRADREVARREREMETLIETSRLSESGPAAILDRIVASVGRALGVEGCCLFLRDADGEPALVASYGFAAGLTAADAAAASRGANRRAAADRRPFFADGRAVCLPDPRIRSALLVPLACQDTLLGTLGLYNKTPSDISPASEFTEHDFRLIALLTQQTSLTLDRSRLAEHLQEALQSLETAQKQLIESERLSAVGRMANMIIHDIKNPMQGIRMFAEMAADTHLSADERREFSETMCHEIDRLVGMCQEILDFARGTTNLLKQDVALDDFLAEVLVSLGPEMEQRRVTLETHLAFGKTLRLDAGRFTRAVLNLCRNALDAMARDGGTLRVATALADDAASIEIADTGPGIPAEIIDKLFEPFVTHGKEHGTGLGLAIVKKVVEDHGGTVEFTTRAGCGTTFVIRVPAVGVERESGGAWEGESVGELERESVGV